MAAARLAGRGIPAAADPRQSRGLRDEAKREENTAPNVLATMVTTTSFGTWLPGDARGYVEDGVILAGDPRVLERSRSLLSKEPVFFDEAQCDALFDALCAAASAFHYVLTDAAIESWHLHWIVRHGYDRVPTMVGRLKTRMRQALDSGRVWTEGYCHTCLYSEEALQGRRDYIARHPGCRMTNGRIIRPSSSRWVDRRR